LIHNHPGGDPTPSRADIQMTQAIVEVAKPLGIAVHDHNIVGKVGARKPQRAAVDLTRAFSTRGQVVHRSLLSRRHDQHV